MMTFVLSPVTFEETDWKRAYHREVIEAKSKKEINQAVIMAINANNFSKFFSIATMTR